MNIMIVHIFIVAGEFTKKLDVIESPRFTTDTILNLFDHLGKGYYIGGV